MNSDLDDVSRDLDTPTAGLEEGDSYFSEDSSLRRHGTNGTQTNSSISPLDRAPSTAPLPTEYSTDTITVGDHSLSTQFMLYDSRYDSNRMILNHG